MCPVLHHLHMEFTGEEEEDGKDLMNLLDMLEVRSRLQCGMKFVKFVRDIPIVRDEATTQSRLRRLLQDKGIKVAFD